VETAFLYGFQQNTCQLAGIVAKILTLEIRRPNYLTAKSKVSVSKRPSQFCFCLKAPSSRLGFFRV
jgi:hypothetical protein